MPELPPKGANLIVVPLDGSPLAERAVPYALALAPALHASLLLVSVCEEGAEIDVLDAPTWQEEIFQFEQQYYQHYLAGLPDRFPAAALGTETVIRVGKPAEEILEVIERRRPELLVIATHGRSGVGRWWYGSVASRLVREAPVQTLVVGPAVLEAGGQAVTFRHILVPLDGSQLAETALGPAEHLAQAAGARLTLARAVRWASQVYPALDPVSLNEELAAAAEKYLSDVRQRVKEMPADTKLLRGPPADTLIEFARDQQVDLVVMASHTRTGAARAVLGSVTDRMIHGPAPVLAVREDDVSADGNEG